MQETHLSGQEDREEEDFEDAEHVRNTERYHGRRELIIPEDLQGPKHCASNLYTIFSMQIPLKL